MKNEKDKVKKSISFFNKLIIILILTLIIPIFILSGILFFGRLSMGQVSVEERFELSSSIKSPYKDIMKGIYEYSFAFCGDPHMQAKGDSVFPELQQYIKANQINFVIFGGDLTFLGKEAEYDNFIEHARALNVPSYPALGNHDLYNQGWDNYWRKLGPSTYSFYGGNAKFIVIDTASGDIGEKQMEWIQKELKENRQPLLFVISHMPVYGCDQDMYEFPRTQEREQLIAMFEKYEVDIVFQGHYHGYTDVTNNGVRYITSGSFTEGLLDAGQRHFLFVRVYGPNVSVEKIIVGQDIEPEYLSSEI